MSRNGSLNNSKITFGEPLKAVATEVQKVTE
jgi:hypothetical protein